MKNGSATRANFWRRVPPAIYCFCLLVSLHSNGVAQNARAVAKKAFPAVVLIVMEDNDGQPLSLGSGFVAGEKQIVSNFHVVEGAARGYVKVVGEKQKHNIQGPSALDRFHDLALIAVDIGSVAPLPLGDSDKLGVGDEVYAVGNPQGLEGTFSQGIISGLRTLGTNKILQITAPISPGSSGGPVLNQSGEVVGVAVATFKGGQNLNFAIPSSHVRELIAQSGKVERLEGGTKKASAESVLNGLGGKSIEGVAGDQFSWTSDLLTIFDQEFSFSLRNLLREPVKNVYCLVVFYDASGKPLEFVTRRLGMNETIPGGLAKRMTGQVDPSVKRLTTRSKKDGFERYEFSPWTKLEIRVLDFELAD